jgi:predicted amidophosphoribosyltransferase
MRAIVQAFKYGGHQTLGPRLAAHLATHPHLHLDSVDIVVPVPLHPWRRLTRGFNQAERVARALGAPVAHPLARLRWRPAQAGLPAEARRAIVHGARSRGRPRLGRRRARPARGRRHHDGRHALGVRAGAQRGRGARGARRRDCSRRTVALLRE